MYNILGMILSFSNWFKSRCVEIWIDTTVHRLRRWQSRRKLHRCMRVDVVVIVTTSAVTIMLTLKSGRIVLVWTCEMIIIIIIIVHIGGGSRRHVHGCRGHWRIRVPTNTTITTRTDCLIGIRSSSMIETTTTVTIRSTTTTSMQRQWFLDGW